MIGVGLRGTVRDAGRGARCGDQCVRRPGSGVGTWNRCAMLKMVKRGASPWIDVFDAQVEGVILI